jgi:hypothetical protein
MANPLIKFVESVAVQDAVYWPPPAPDTQGDLIYPTAQDMKVRWDNKATNIVDPQGRNVVAKASVLLTAPVAAGGRMCLGTVAALPAQGATSPTSVGADEILQVEETPLFRSASEFVRVAYL